jgi:CHAD domain-containing protein
MFIGTGSKSETVKNTGGNSANLKEIVMKNSKKRTRTDRSGDTSAVTYTEMKAIRREIRRLRKQVTVLSEELAANNKDLASSIDCLQEYVETLSDEYYAMLDEQLRSLPADSMAQSAASYVDGNMSNLNQEKAPASEHTHVPD